MLNILVAEDDPFDLLIFKEALGDVLPDFNVIHARNGLQCINILRTEPAPDVIFLDIRMPLRTGLECLDIIKSMSRLKKVPIIMLSTSDQIDDVEGSYNRGASLYLVKPTEVKSLTITLKGAFHMLGRPKKELQVINNFVVKDIAYSKYY